jgi:hypothetical protein
MKTQLRRSMKPHRSMPLFSPPAKRVVCKAFARTQTAQVERGGFYAALWASKGKSHKIFLQHSTPHSGCVRPPARADRRLRRAASFDFRTLPRP